MHGAGRSSYTLNWPVMCFLLLLHPPGTFYLLTFDCENILTFKRHLKNHLFKLRSACAASSTSVSSDLKSLYKSVIIIIRVCTLCSFATEEEAFA